MHLEVLRTEMSSPSTRAIVVYSVLYVVVYSVLYVVVYSVLYIVYSAPRGVAHRDELAKHVREPAQPAALPRRCCLLARRCCAAGAGSAAAVVEEYEDTYMQQRSMRTHRSRRVV